MSAIWLLAFAVQLVLCLYLGYRVARKTERSLLNWLFVGFLAAIPPIVGPVLMIVCALWYPPRMPRAPLRGANPDEKRATGRRDERTATRRSHEER
jgi:hypothetical protein